MAVRRAHEGGDVRDMVYREKETNRERVALILMAVAAAGMLGACDSGDGAASEQDGSLAIAPRAEDDEAMTQVASPEATTAQQQGEEAAVENQPEQDAGGPPKLPLGPSWLNRTVEEASALPGCQGSWSAESSDGGLTSTYYCEDFDDEAYFDRSKVWVHTKRGEIKVIRTRTRLSYQNRPVPKAIDQMHEQFVSDACNRLGSDDHEEYLYDCPEMFMRARRNYWNEIRIAFATSNEEYRRRDGPQSGGEYQLIGIPYRLGDLIFTVHRVEVDNDIGKRDKTLEDDEAFVVVRYTVENAGSEDHPARVSATRWRLVTPDGEELRRDRETSLTYVSRMSGASHKAVVRPGRSDAHAVVFRVPREVAEQPVTVKIEKPSNFGVPEALRFDAIDLGLKADGE